MKLELVSLNKYSHILEKEIEKEAFSLQANEAIYELKSLLPFP